MGRKKWNIIDWILGATLLVNLAACSTIDEDLSDCGEDFEMEYELQLITNIETELQTELVTGREQLVADALRNHLANIFTDVARDIDLSFYATGKEDALQYHKSELMNANEKSYSFFLPAQDYRHLALANLQNNSVVSVTGGDQSATQTLVQKQGETIESHETGLFTAREDMKVKEGEDQTFHVDLYMANSATALVIDNARGVEVKDIQVYATGFATAFSVNDSTYTYVDNPPMVHAQQVSTDADDMLCFCTVNFPSRDKAVGEEPLWQYVVYVTLADGSVTQSVLSLKEPLMAGNLKIVKTYLQADGSLQPDNTLVGVSVTLDWKQGGTYEPEM
jgi:hypothetical protein